MMSVNSANPTAKHGQIQLARAHEACDVPKPIWRKWLMAFALCAIFCSTWADSASAQSRSRRFESTFNDYTNQVAELREDLTDYASQAKQLNNQTLLREIERKLEILSNARPLGTQLPRQLQSEIPFTLTPDQRALQVGYRKTCSDAATNFYLLARRIMEESPTHAFGLVNLTLQIDPDHAKARSLRGYVRQGDEWLTAFERDQLRANKVNHPRFGWLPKSRVDKYENGERYFRGNWVTAAKEAEIRRDFRYAWQIQTEHFLIKTNVDFEQGVELGRKLETFYDYFQQTFALFYNTPEQLKKLFDGTTGRAKPRAQLYEVHYFRTKQEYVDRLKSRIPQIAMTNGLYQLEDRVSYFFHDPNANNDATLFHEATHQLMYESHARQRDVGRDAHFWIIEGIACYMESFVIEPPEPESDSVAYSVGDPRFVRFYWARHRMFEEDYTPGLESLARLGLKPFQTGSQQDLQRRYSVASGLSHFFMHFNNGQYRDALMVHLSQLYDSNPLRQRNALGLDRLTGVPYRTLDQQYRQYLQDQQLEVGTDPVIQ